MTAAVLPHTVKPHPITGVYSGKLGMWLFLASEAMLFGGLFSAYVLLRVTAPAEGPAAWPVDNHAAHLDWRIGGFNTLLLIVSSVTMVMAWVSLKMNNLAKGKMFLMITVALASLFLVLKVTLEYLPQWHDGYTMAHSNFYGLYYTMTGLHGLHIFAGIVVMLYFIGPGSALWKQDPEYFTNRIECTGLYWHFVDLVWIFLFPTFYLMN